MNARARTLPTMLLMALPLMAAAQEPPLKSSDTDYSLPAARERPVTCKQGDLQPFEGKAMGQVFGDAWPATPAPTTAHAPAKVLTRGDAVPPPGGEDQLAVVVVAVLVGADGRALAAEPVCMTSAAFVEAAKASLRDATFAPATIDGVPVTSVVAVPIVFKPGHDARKGGGKD